MKLFQPQVQLVRQNNVGEPDSYFIHAVTFCDRTCYQASGHAPLPISLDADGNFVLELYITENVTESLDFELLTPVVHTISLGQVPFENGDGNVVVEMVIFPTEDDRNNNTNGNKTGIGIINSTGAMEDGRPIAIF